MNTKLLLVVAVSVGGGAWALWPSGADANGATPSTDLYTVRRDDLRITITENGTMVAKDSQKVKTKIRGESKIQFLIEEGKQVEQGEVVCRLDPTKVEEGIEQLQLEISKTQARLKTARTELEILEVENVAALAKAKNAEKRAKQEIEKYRDGEAPQERRKLEVALKDTETKYVRAKKELDVSKKLLEQKYIKQYDFDDLTITFESAEVQRQSAQVGLDIFDKYSFPMKMQDLDLKLTDATREIATIGMRGEAKMGEETVSVQQVEKQLTVQQKSLKDRTEDRDNMTLSAPCPGIVVYGNPHEPWYRDRVKVGNSVHRGMTLLTIPDLRIMQVNLDIHEADISKLKKGLPAFVTTDSYPGLVMEGVVTKIAAVATSNGGYGGRSEVKKFRVQITLQATEMQLRPGISAKVEIRVDTRKQALFVPLQSVFAEDGVYYCHVSGGAGPPVRRRLQVGTSNDTYIEVLEGLDEQEHVLLFNPFLPSSGATNTSSDEQPQGSSEDGASDPGKTNPGKSE